jgi:surface antigen
MTHFLRKSLTVTIAAASLLALAACDNYGTKQTIGGLTGAAGGGLLGAQFGDGKTRLATTAAGTLAGALIGSEIGRSMDTVDKMKVNQAQQQASAAPVGETIAWNNPNTGNSGSVTTLRDGTSANGRYCREFQQTVVVGGQVQDSYGVACRQPDGSWQLI